MHNKLISQKMNMQTIDNQIVKLKEFQKKNRLQTKEIAELLGVSLSLLYKLYKNERIPQPETIEEIKKLIRNYEAKYPNINVETTVSERETTYKADSVKIPDFEGENPQIVFLEKLKYLSKIGEMREAGLLDEDEFLKIKSRLINSL